MENIRCPNWRVLLVLKWSKSSAMRPWCFYNTLIVLAGTAVLPKYTYAYSQTDFILYDQLSTGTYQGPWQVLVQSRRMMKGYKWKRFLLDLSFIGWYILIGITLGIAGVVAYLTSLQLGYSFMKI